jgi:hypothetical protein
MLYHVKEYKMSSNRVFKEKAKIFTRMKNVSITQSPKDMQWLSWGVTDRMPSNKLISTSIVFIISIAFTCTCLFGYCVIETFFIRLKIFAFSLKTLFEDNLYSFTWYNIWHCYIVKCFLNIKFCILFLCFEVRRILEVITISNFRPKRNKCFCQYKRIFCCQNEKCQVKDSKFFTNFFFTS